jgi:hypothetical protein
MTLIDRILRLAELWAEARGHSTTSRLSTIVANDGGLLKRVGGGGGTTVATLDKFAVFLRDFANWPDNTPPDEARVLIHELCHIASLPDGERQRDAA